MIRQNENMNSILLEAYRLAELELQTETTIAISSDQRAISFCGILIAAVAILASISEKSTTTIVDDLSLLLLSIAAGISAYAARSTKITATGMSFSSFAEDIESEKNFSEVISELASHYEIASKANRKVISHNSKCFNSSLIVACLGLALAVFPQVKAIVFF